MTTLAIDIGGTKIAAAVCDENDAITHRWRVPTPMDADAINHHIANIYHEAVAAGHDDIQAIGISAAGNVGADRRTLTFAANIPAWINYDLSEHIGALIDHAVPVVVENDATVRSYAAETFRDLGFETAEASDASAALAILAANRPITLLFTDVGLPGMNGHELAAEALAPGLV